MSNGVQKWWFKCTQLKMRKELFPFYRERDRLTCKQKAVTGCKKKKQKNTFWIPGVWPKSSTLCTCTCCDSFVEPFILVRKPCLILNGVWELSYDTTSGNHAISKGHKTRSHSSWLYSCIPRPRLLLLTPFWSQVQPHSSLPSTGKPCHKSDLVSGTSFFCVYRCQQENHNGFATFI